MGKTVEPVCESIKRYPRIPALAGGLQSCEVGRFTRCTTALPQAEARGKRTIKALQPPDSDEDDDHQATDPPPGMRCRPRLRRSGLRRVEDELRVFGYLERHGRKFDALNLCIVHVKPWYR